MLFEIILAANYLDIKPLLYVPALPLVVSSFAISRENSLTSFFSLSPSVPRLSLPAQHTSSSSFETNSDVGCKTVANMIKGKQPEEIRKL